MIEIETASGVIEALDGDHAVAKWTGRSVQAVRNWRYGRGIPPALRPYMDARLGKRGKSSAATAYSTYKPKDLKLPPRKTGGSQRRGTQ